MDFTFCQGLFFRAKHNTISLFVSREPGCAAKILGQAAGRRDTLPLQEPSSRRRSQRYQRAGRGPPGRTPDTHPKAPDAGRGGRPRRHTPGCRREGRRGSTVRVPTLESPEAAWVPRAGKAVLGPGWRERAGGFGGRAGGFGGRAGAAGSSASACMQQGAGREWAPRGPGERPRQSFCDHRPRSGPRAPAQTFTAPSPGPPARTRPGPANSRGF